MEILSHLRFRRDQTNTELYCISGITEKQTREINKRCTGYKALRTALAKLQWVSVEERLPERECDKHCGSAKVMVTDGHWWWASRYDWKYKKWTPHSHGVIISWRHVTMPIPTLPEAE